MPSWERLQEGPEDPITDEVDADILLYDGGSRTTGTGLSTEFSKLLKTKLCLSALTATVLLFLVLVPTIFLLSGKTASSLNQPKFKYPPVRNSTPFIEPIDFESSSQMSIRSFSPPDFSPIMDFVYDYLSLLESTSNSSTTGAPMEVSVYYETLSIPSRTFLSHQFFPAFFNSSNGKSLKFLPKLIPFGHANLSLDSSGGLDKFSCEHGSDECQGNLVHACAIRHTNWKNPLSVTRLMHYINCMMEDTGGLGGLLTTAANQIGQSCGRTTGFSWDPIYACTQNQEGAVVLKSFRKKTEAVMKANDKAQLPIVALKGYVLSETEKKDFASFIQRRLEN